VNRDVLVDKRRLVHAFLKAQALADPVSEFYADLTVDVYAFSRELKGTGIKLSEKWENHDHLKIKVRGIDTPIDFHVRSNKVEEGQPFVATISRSDRNPEEVAAYFLPEQSQIGINYVLNEIFKALPAKTIDALYEKIPQNDPDILREVESIGYSDYAGKQKAFAVVCASRGIELE